MPHDDARVRRRRFTCFASACLLRTERSDRRLRPQASSAIADATPRGHRHSHRRNRAARHGAEVVPLVVNCVRSIVERSSYENYELICVFDSSTDPDTLRALETIAGDRLRLVEYAEAFNFSRKINVGVRREPTASTSCS